MKKQIGPKISPERVEGISLSEIHEALEWFGVRITVPALRQTMAELDIEPRLKAAGRSGRGRSFYYDYSVVWLLASVYHAVYSPKTKLAEIRKWLKEKESSLPERFSISEFFDVEGASKPSRDHPRLRAVYMGFVTHPEHGLDLRVVTDVARLHPGQAGLSDCEIHDALLEYKRQTLVRLGVPARVAEGVALD